MLERARNEAGFTVVEVIVIVAFMLILAGVATSSFSAYRADAHDAQAVTSLRNLATAQNLHFAMSGSFASDVADLASFQPTDGVAVEIGRADSTGFFASATHRDGTRTFRWDSDEGLLGRSGRGVPTDT